MDSREELDQKSSSSSSATFSKPKRDYSQVLHEGKVEEEESRRKQIEQEDESISFKKKKLNSSVVKNGLFSKNQSHIL